MTDDELLEALAARLRDEPPAWDDATAEAAAARALAAADDEALIDAFADALRAEPPPAPAGQVDAALARAARRPWRWLAPLAAAAVVAIAVGVAWSTTRPPAPAVAPAAIDTTLAAGHRVLTTPGARLRVVDGERVRVRLESGAALFDVVPGADFEVRAGDVLVRVTGTVFTVARTGAEVAVEVFEGSVEVMDGAARRALTAGMRHGAGTDALREPALRAARARESRSAAETGETAQTAQTAETAAPPSPRPPEPRPVEAPPPPDASRARRLLAAGRHPEAYALARQASSLGLATFEWAMIEGDALRGLHRDEAAVAAYRRAERRGDAGERAVAGLAGARVLDAPLHRAADARETLRRSGALDDGSPVVSAARRLDARLAGR